MRPAPLGVIAVVLAGLVISPPVAAQQQPDQGQVRVQGRPLVGPATPRAGGAQALIDLREEMRRLVQSISAFARRYRRDFAVVGLNGLELLAKRDDIDETRILPARTYMQALDGVMQAPLFYGAPAFGEPVPAEARAQLLPLADMAKTYGLKVMVMDYVDDRGGVDASYRENAAKGYVSFAAPAPAAAITSLPRHPRRPFNANPNSVLSMGAARNFLYIGDSSRFGREDEFALKIHETNYDVVVVDVFHGRLPLSKQAVETLKYKKLGSKRLVLARVDVGSAASYRYYWQPGWREGSPIWISAPFPDEPDRYFVEYWRPEWKRIVYGDTNSYVYGVIDQGFDGVLLTGLDAYRFFEGGAEAEDLVSGQ